MKRDTLRTYLRRLVLTSLAACALHACTSQCPTAHTNDTVGFSPYSDPPDGGFGNDIDGGWYPLSVCHGLCSNSVVEKITRCRAYNSDRFGLTLSCDGEQRACPILDSDAPSGESGYGRRTAGLHEPTIDTAALGGWLARAAYLEAASVDAFERLAQELAAHGAPAQLIARARVAAEEERRHAAVLGRLVQLHGAEVPPVAIDTLSVRTLEEVAQENAVEGCVHETFGAAVNIWQAHTACDRRLRVAMQRISVDEAGHAELAWAVARWAELRLDVAGRQRVCEARRAAAHALAGSADPDPPMALTAAAGLMPRARARRLVARLSRDLWT